MAYVYRHIRLDKNVPFYIGIGSDKDYKRAHAFKKRNRYWSHIINKHDYKVEILMDDLTWEDACKKETEFILLYGREDLNLGTLTNLTNGGDGIFGFKFSDESKQKMSKSQKNKKPITEETRERMRKASQGRDTAAHIRGVKWSEKIEYSEILKNRNLSLTGRKKPTAQCPNCGLIGGVPQMVQWHFNNCKHKKK